MFVDEWFLDWGGFIGFDLSVCFFLIGVVLRIVGILFLGCVKGLFEFGVVGDCGIGGLFIFGLLGVGGLFGIVFVVIGDMLLVGGVLVVCGVGIVVWLIFVCLMGDIGVVGGLFIFGLFGMNVVLLFVIVWLWGEIRGFEEFDINVELRMLLFELVIWLVFGLVVMGFLGMIFGDELGFNVVSGEFMVVVLLEFVVVWGSGFGGGLIGIDGKLFFGVIFEDLLFVCWFVMKFDRFKVLVGIFVFFLDFFVFFLIEFVVRLFL